MGFKTQKCAGKASFKSKTVTQQETQDKVTGRVWVRESNAFLQPIKCSSIRHSDVDSQSQSDQQEHTGSHWRKVVRSPPQALLPPLHSYCMTSGMPAPCRACSVQLWPSPLFPAPHLPIPQTRPLRFLYQNRHSRACNSQICSSGGLTSTRYPGAEATLALSSFTLTPEGKRGHQARTESQQELFRCWRRAFL